MYILKSIFIMFVLTGIVQAQFTKSLEINSSYDDNLFRSPDPETDILTDITLDLNYQPEESHFSLNYVGNAFIYQDNALRNFSLHSFGLDYSSSFGTDDIHGLYIGTDYSFRINGDDFDYYNYNQLYLFSNLRLDLNWAYLTTGYNYRWRRYSNVPELSNNQHTGFVQLNKSFDTRTTIIVEADLGMKSFDGQRTYSSIMMSSGGGKGRGSHMGSETTATSTTDIPSLSQAVLLTRVSQSLHDKVGIYLQYRQQISLTEKTSFVNGDDYYQDEELFDDPFSYESKSVSSQLTWMMPWTLKMQIGGALVSKDYISEQAFTSAEDSVGAGGNRVDDRNSLYINLSKTLFLNKAWVKSLQFNLYYNYIRSESNSYWYNYRNNVFGGGIEWNF